MLLRCLSFSKLCKFYFYIFIPYQLLPAFADFFFFRLLICLRRRVRSEISASANRYHRCRRGKSFMFTYENIFSDIYMISWRDFLYFVSSMEKDLLNIPNITQLFNQFDYTRIMKIYSYRHGVPAFGLHLSLI